MEFAIAILLGAFLTCIGIICFRRIRKDFQKSEDMGK